MSECPQRTLCRCGKQARKIVAPVSFRFGKNLGHVDKPDDEREATVMARDYSEWQIAASGSDEGFEHRATDAGGKVTDALSVPRKDEVLKKREAIRHGVKPPKGITVKA